MRALISDRQIASSSPAMMSPSMCALLALAAMVTEAGAFAPLPGDVTHSALSARAAGRSGRLGAAVRASSVPTGRRPDAEVLAPSKVNLFLRILRRREDGYHELASLFQALALGDTLRVWRLDAADAPHSSMSIMLEGEPAADAAEVPVDSSNLVLRALELFSQKTGVKQPVHVELVKRIPVQAGMGGGSADAAAALFAANRLAGYPASMADLREWGGELGSDISFFFSSGTAYCTGRGEQIESLPPLGPCPITVLKPPEGLSTGLVYKTLDLGALSTAEPTELLSRMRAPGGLLDAGAYVNDLEPPALSLLPRLDDIKAELRSRGWKVAMMSGSGTSVFCLGPPDGAPPLEGWDEGLGATCFATEFATRNVDDETAWYGE